jgi:MFS family permease
MSLVTLLGFVPTLLLSVPAGVLADRYDRRILMMIGDGFSAMGILFILICMMTKEATLFEICLGVFVSAVFSALLEPSYKATITDILSKEEYSKANGLVSMAGSARYLFSPVIAGFLLGMSDVKLLLIIDISTFFVTLVSVAVIRKKIVSVKVSKDESFVESIKGGFKALSMKKGILILVVISSGVTLSMGMFQILAEPLILSFSDAKTLGISETVCAVGMLFSGVVLGIKGLKKSYVKKLSLSLAFAGLFMVGFGIKENIILICTFGFLFFAVLPVANNCLDYLTRTNIPDEVQGRVWGLIGFISQLGYVVSYSVSGISADMIGRASGLGVGRGAAYVVQTAGIMLFILALLIPKPKSIKQLET